MFNKEILSSEQARKDVEFLKKAAFGKQICLMVTTQAYGQSLKEIVSLFSGIVDAFGVTNEEDAFAVREVDKTSRVILFGECGNFSKLTENNIEFAIFSLKMLKKVLKNCKNDLFAPSIHVAFNSIMNGYETSDKREFDKIIDLLNMKNITPTGFFTYFSLLTIDDESNMVII